MSRPNTYTRRLGNGVTLKAEVSPCVRMDRGYPFQAQVTIRQGGEDRGSVYVKDESKTWETYTIDTIKALVSRVKIKPCSRCTAPSFDPSTCATNRGGLCEACFTDDERAQWNAELEKVERRANARARKAGAKFRVVAWVHTSRGDRECEILSKTRPTDAQVKTYLRRLGSLNLGDYQIIPVVD